MTGSAARTAELRAALAGLAGALAHPRPFAGVDPDTIDAMFVPGGAGPMEDLYDDRDLGRIAPAYRRPSAAADGTVPAPDRIPESCSMPRVPR